MITVCVSVCNLLEVEVVEVHNDKYVIHSTSFLDIETNIIKTAHLRKLLKRLGHEIEFKYFEKNVLLCVCTTFQAVKMKTYEINSMFWSSLPNYLAALFVTRLPHWLLELLIPIGPLFQLQYSFLYFVNAYSRTEEKAKTFLCGTRICFACSQKSIRVWSRSFWNNIGSFIQWY
jgi:hypothetical protein